MRLIYLTSIFTSTVVVRLIGINQVSEDLVVVMKYNQKVTTIQEKSSLTTKQIQYL